MAWRIDEIKIANFKAFAKEQTIPIGRKNLLLYGDNGSGKSSIFGLYIHFIKVVIKKTEQR